MRKYLFFLLPKSSLHLLVIFFLSISTAIVLARNINPLKSTQVQAQTSRVEWSMVGANNQRTSFLDEPNFPMPGQPDWHVRFQNAYIPNQAHIITADRGSDSRILVPTSKGLYALHPDTGDEIWFYATTQPMGNSPTVVGDIAYLPVLELIPRFYGIQELISEKQELIRGYTGLPTGLRLTIPGRITMA